MIVPACWFSMSGCQLQIVDNAGAIRELFSASSRGTETGFAEISQGSNFLEADFWPASLRGPSEA